MSTPIPDRLGRLHERILTSVSNSSPRYAPSFRSVLALRLFNLKVHGLYVQSLNNVESCGRISRRPAGWKNNLLVHLGVAVPPLRRVPFFDAQFIDESFYSIQLIIVRAFEWS